MSKNIVYKPQQGKTKGDVIVLRLIIAGLIVVGIVAAVVVWKYGASEKTRQVEVDIPQKDNKQYINAIAQATVAGKLIEQGNWTKARQKLAFAREHGADTVDYYLASGKIAVKDRMYLRAADLLERAVSKGDNKSDTWVMLICTLNWAGENNRQLVAVSQAIEGNKNSPKDLIWIANRLEQFEIYKSALEIYSYASSKQAVAWDATISAANCSLKLGKLNRAEKFIQRARQLDSGNPKILELINRLIRQRKESRPITP